MSAKYELGKKMKAHLANRRGKTRSGHEVERRGNDRQQECKMGARDGCRRLALVSWPSRSRVGHGLRRGMGQVGLWLKKATKIEYADDKEDPYAR